MKDKLWILLNTDLKTPFIMVKENGMECTQIGYVIVLAKDRIEARQKIHAMISINADALVDPRIIEVKELKFEPAVITYN